MNHKLANLFGYELIKKRNLNDTLKQNLSNVFDSAAINCVIDVGANNGQYGTMLREISYSRRIVSFEPVAEAFEQLERNSRDDRDWEAVNIALGAEESVLEINRLKASDLSSFRQPNAYGNERFAKGMEFVERQQVEMKTLAQLWEGVVGGIDEPRVFLKMDTQGFDLEVLNGGSGAGFLTRHAIRAVIETSLRRNARLPDSAGTVRQAWI
jgi:FkbM family methyltransferase